MLAVRGMPKIGRDRRERPLPTPAPPGPSALHSCLVVRFVLVPFPNAQYSPAIRRPRGLGTGAERSGPDQDQGLEAAGNS